MKKISLVATALLAVSFMLPAQSGPFNRTDQGQNGGRSSFAAQDPGHRGPRHHRHHHHHRPPM